MGKNKKAVLADQRPKKSYFRIRMIIRFLVLSFATFGFVVGGYLLYKQSQKKYIYLNSSKGPKIDWTIQLKAIDNQSVGVQDELHNKIVSIVKKYLNDGSKENLVKVAETIQEQTAFAKVHLLKTSPSSIVVSFERRKPVLAVDVGGQTRLVSEEGVVYAKAAEDAGYPVIRGVFPLKIKDYEFNRDQSLIMTDNESIAIKEAVSLYSLSQKYGRNVQNMKYEEYRGFYIVLVEEGTEVFLGRAPFEEKLKKLDSILKNLQKKGSKAARIELDYTGKAFIKEKKS